VKLVGAVALSQVVVSLPVAPVPPVSGHVTVMVAADAEAAVATTRKQKAKNVRINLPLFRFKGPFIPFTNVDFGPCSNANN
jgi:hypothetical protein